MKYIEVIEFTPAAGKEYSADGYPGVGLFLDKFGALRAVYIVAGGSVPCAIELGRLAAHVKEQVEFAVSSIQQPTGISANDLLKAIAISQQPGLAVELTK